jgi:hypothetical protein
VLCDFVLLVTRFLARMNAAIKWSTAGIRTLECSNPLFLDFFAVVARIRLLADPLILAIAAENRLLHLTAIAAGIDSNLASSAKSFVTRPLAKVFATRHELTAYLSTAPSVLVVGINALSCM